MKRKNFTLVELLSVMVLMTLIMGIGIPAFNYIAKGSAVSQASRELAANLMLARSIAIEKRTPVAVVFPTLNSSQQLEGYTVQQSGRDLTPYCNASYRLCYVYKDGSGNYNFRAWVPEENWFFLPAGVVIPGVSDPDNFQGGITVNDVHFSRVLDPDATNDAAATVDLSRALIFKPNGQLVGSAEPQIRLAEGYVEPSSGVIYATNRDNNDVPMTRLTLNLYSGRVAIDYTTKTTTTGKL